MTTIKYHYLLMTQFDFLENETLEELLREKTSYYLTKEKNKDFWVIINPKFVYADNSKINNLIKETKFYQNYLLELNAENLEHFGENNFYAVLVSTDSKFIRWMELRLGFFEEENCIVKDTNAKVNGFKGSINFPNFLDNINPIHFPSYYLRRSKGILEKYFSDCK